MPSTMGLWRMLKLKSASVPTLSSPAWGTVGNGQAWVAQVVFGTVAEDDYVAMLFMLFEGIPNAFFFTQTVDKVEVAFEILGDILAYSVVAALLKNGSRRRRNRGV